jgi:uncharacterized repeat protein (TIGR03803 family)
MKTLRLNRYALSISVIAVSLAACGGSQSSVAAPGAIPQSSIRTKTSSSYRVLYRFDRFPNGAIPEAGLIDVGGSLYGTAERGGSTVCHEDGPGCGTIYGITTGGAESLVFTFTRTYGAFPVAPLIDVKGTLYGTASDGGWSQRGTVYSITTAGSMTTLHTFSGRPPHGDGKDGLYPSRSPLVYVNGTLYGTTIAGGGTPCNSGCGTVYTISASDHEKLLYKFQGGSDGAWPIGLIDVNGTFYGTTFNGGGSGCGGAQSHPGCGTIFTITASGVEKVLYRFQGGADGSSPQADLVDVDGTFYGTTAYGGASGDGTVFTVTTSGKHKVLYSFAGGTDGAQPLAALVDVNGTLYGTTSEGGGATACGSTGCGTVYSINTAGAENVLYAFAGDDDGSYPEAALLDVKGTLYGATDFGGVTHGDAEKCCGTVFALTP